MHVPSDDEMAAIAAAYAVVTAQREEPSPPAASRWRLAGRQPSGAPQRVRHAARVSSRWSAAGRIDG